MRIILMMFLLVSISTLMASENAATIDYQPIRVNITNWCVRAFQSEQVWDVGATIKVNRGFSDAQMTELLAGCIPMIESRTDYKISHFHLFGLLERVCGTNSLPVLVQVIRDNKNDYDVRFAYSAYCVICDMDESCFTLGSEILDSPSSGEWSRWAVYSRIGRRRAKALKAGDQTFLQRCDNFYRSRYKKDVDFRKNVGYQKWPDPTDDGGVE